MRRGFSIRPVLRCLRRLERAQRYTTHQHREELPHVKDANHPFYNYTSGRWLYNEHLRLSERHLHFNLDALHVAIAKSVNQSHADIVRFTKLAEGGSYRGFEAAFRDGLRVIARLPYPSTIPRNYGISSEVATMEFLRLHGLPIPRIYDWSSSTSNKVGSEYIIMERVPGKELEDTWYTMTLRERMAVIEKIVNIEKVLFGIRFPASGSLFFKDSLNAGVKSVDIPKYDDETDVSGFCIGPSTDYLWWYQNRHELGANHGPWISTEELLRAVGERELLWLRRFGKARHPREPLYREVYNNRMVDPQVQMNHLLNYLKVAPHLVPKAEELNVPTIRHPDFSPNNIFISDSGDITGIIDWQNTTVIPLFLQAKIPKHFQNYGDDDSETFRRPRLPEEFDALSDSDKEYEMELHRRRQVHYCYVGFTSRYNKAHFNAMGKYNLVLRNQLYDTAGRPWEGDNTSLQAQLITTLKNWSEISPAGDVSDPPVHYSAAESQECVARDAQQKEADAQKQQVREHLGVDIEGWVLNSEFSGAREKARELKTQMLEAADTEEERRELDTCWPFQDHEEID